MHLSMHLPRLQVQHAMRLHLDFGEVDLVHANTASPDHHNVEVQPLHPIEVFGRVTRKQLAAAD